MHTPGKSIHKGTEGRMVKKFTCLFDDTLKTLTVLLCQRVVLLSNSKTRSDYAECKNSTAAQPFYCPQCDEVQSQLPFFPFFKKQLNVNCI